MDDVMKQRLKEALGRERDTRNATLDEVRRRVVELKSRDCFGATYGECGEDVLAILDAMKESS